jgi:DNA processing protein
VSLAITPDVRDLLALHLLPGLGPRLTAALLRRFGSAGAVLRAGAAQSREVPHIGPKLSLGLSQALRAVGVDAELALIARHGIHLRRIGTPEYPAALAQIHGPPHLLYARGTIEPGDAKAVALVGSRRFTGYGEHTPCSACSPLGRGRQFRVRSAVRAKLYGGLAAPVTNTGLGPG